MNRAFTAHSLSVRWAMEKTHAAEIAARLRELRNASRETDRRVTNRMIARHCKVAERTVAGWLSEDDPKGLTYPHAIKCAELFEVDVRWLWDGQTQKETPDLMGQLNGSLSEKLDRIEDLAQRILDAVAPIAAARLLAAGGQAKPESRSPSARAQASSAKKPRAAKRRAG